MIHMHIYWVAGHFLDNGHCNRSLRDENKQTRSVGMTFYSSSLQELRLGMGGTKKRNILMVFKCGEIVFTKKPQQITFPPYNTKRDSGTSSSTSGWATIIKFLFLL